MESMMTSMILFKAGASLLLVVALMVLLVYVLRFLQGRKKAMTPKADRIQIAQVHHVNAKQKLMVIRWGDKESLVAMTPTGGFLIDQKDTEKQDVKHGIS